MARRQLAQHKHSCDEDDRQHADSSGGDEDNATPHGRQHVP